MLFGIEDEFDVLSVDRLGPGQVKIIIELVSRAGACPACGVVSGRVKDRPLRRIADLPASGQPTQLWCRKRRLVCMEALCARRTFTQTSEAIRPRARVTQRLRRQLATAIAAGNRAVSEVAREYGASWPTAHRALVAAAARWLPEPTATTRLGIDQTRFRSVRWLLDGVTWRRSDPWLTSFVDCSADGPGSSLLGLAPGRTGGCVQAWLGEQTPAFRDRIELVVIDPSAPYAAGIRAALPKARIAVDKWHLVALANQMVTEVRQRVTRDQLGRRGTTADPVWVNRRLLLTGAEHLSTKQWRRLTTTLDRCNPTNEIGAAWGVKERLRLLLAESEPSKIRRRLADFYDATLDAAMPETSRLANTIQTWWPAILVALTEQLTNARTEGLNRIIKRTKRVGCGYCNLDNYRQIKTTTTGSGGYLSTTVNAALGAVHQLIWEVSFSGKTAPLKPQRSPLFVGVSDRDGGPLSQRGESVEHRWAFHAVDMAHHDCRLTLPRPGAGRPPSDVVADRGRLKLAVGLHLQPDQALVDGQLRDA